MANKNAGCPCLDASPQPGNVFYCAECGHSVLTLTACPCDDSEAPCHACCGKAMVLVNPSPNGG